MDTSYEKSKNSTDEWYTPPYIFENLGKFDLDPCAPINPLWDTADNTYTIQDDGLKQQWFGRVWLNPPYSRPLLEQFVIKLANHGNGIALLFNRCDCKLFQNIIFKQASGIKFIKGRVKFYNFKGEQTGTPGCGSVLVAFGEQNATILEQSNIQGWFSKIIYEQIKQQ